MRKREDEKEKIKNDWMEDERMKRGENNRKKIFKKVKKRGNRGDKNMEKRRGQRRKWKKRRETRG